MIKLSPNMAIKADKRSFSICYLRTHVDKKTGDTVENWVPEFHYSEPDSLFKKLINLAVSEGIQAGSWGAVRKSVDAAKTQINSVLAGQLGL